MMDYPGAGDYDVNTPFKYEEDEPPSDGVEDNRPHTQDDLLYTPLDFAHGDVPSTSTSNSHSNMMDTQPSIDLVTSSSNGTSHILGSNVTTDSVVMETNDAVPMETNAPSSPESDEIPLAARTRTRPSRSTRSKKSFAEVNEEEDEEVFETKPPKGININLYEITTPLVGTQSIFRSDVQKERRANLTKGSKKKKKKEPEFCRFCFTNELTLTKIRSAKLPPSSSHPNTKLTTLVPAVSEVELCLSEKWTNPSFQLVCDDCVLVFSQFYEFRQAVQTNDVLLRRLYCSSKAKSKKLPTTPTSAPVTPTPKGRGRPPKVREISSDDESDAKSTVSTKSNKKKARGKRKGVTDDEETDGYLSSVSKTSRKSTTSRKGGKKKKGGVTSDEETDGYMSSVSKKSTNTGSAAKSKKKRRYNSDSDNEDVKSDVSDGMDYAPTAYESLKIEQGTINSTEPLETTSIDLEDQDRREIRATQKRRKKERSARKRAKWNFNRTTVVKDAATKAQEELDMLNRRIKQEQESSEEENRDDVFGDSSWDDSSGITSSEWSSVDDVDNNDEETDGYMTSASTRSTGKKRRKYKKKKKERNLTGCESETGGETDGEGPRIKTQDMLGHGMDLEDNDKTDKRKRSKRSEDLKCRAYNQKRSRIIKHFRKEKFPCKYCKMVLSSFDGYYRHLKSNHKRFEVSTLCHICGYHTTRRKTLDGHIREQHVLPAKKRKICEICSAEVYYIQGHIKDKHSGFFVQCPHCHKRFTRKTDLNVHIKAIHTKPDQTFVCKHCNKEFKMMQYLKRHMQIHTIDKPYKCQCGVGFSFNVSLKNHKKTCLVH